MKNSEIFRQSFFKAKTRFSLWQMTLILLGFGLIFKACHSKNKAKNHAITNFLPTTNLEEIRKFCSIENIYIYSDLVHFSIMPEQIHIRLTAEQVQSFKKSIALNQLEIEIIFNKDLCQIQTAQLETDIIAYLENYLENAQETGNFFIPSSLVINGLTYQVGIFPQQIVDIELSYRNKPLLNNGFTLEEGSGRDYFWLYYETVFSPPIWSLEDNLFSIKSEHFSWDETMVVAFEQHDLTSATWTLKSPFYEGVIRHHILFEHIHPDFYLLWDNMAALNKMADFYNTPESHIVQKILYNLNYTQEDFTDFFTNFYEKEPLNNTLKDGLYYFLFAWSNQRHQHLAMMDYFDPVKLTSNPDTSTYNKLSLYGLLLNTEQSRILDYTDEIRESLMRAVEKNSYLQKIKTETDLILAEIAIKTQDMIINTGDWNPVTQAKYLQLFRLSGSYSQLLSKDNLFIFDNYKMSADQIKVIRRFWNLFPQYLIKPYVRSFSIADYYPKNTRVSAGFFNTYDTPVGAVTENAFSLDEVPTSVPTDLFSTALSHEMGHQIDPVLMNTNAKFRNRKAELIHQAGRTEYKNYLRGFRSEPDFFAENTQEFIASMCNQWFSNTFTTFELAVKRFLQGYKEPINQFLFMADLMTEKLGSNYTYFYTNDQMGNLEREIIPLERNKDGFIESIKIKDRRFEFMLDKKGNVIEIF